MKKNIVRIGLSLVVIAAVVATIGWIGFKNAFKVNTYRVDDHLTVFEGGGGNSIVLTSEDGSTALVVDTKMGAGAKNIAAAVKAGNVVVVNTHLHSDHTGGNSLFPQAVLISGAYTPDEWKKMAGKSKYPDIAIQAGRDTVIEIGSEKVRICNRGVAHSWNDVVVYLENRKLLVTGDIVFNRMHPAMFAMGGSDVTSWIKVLQRLIDEFDATKVLPGHGPMGGKEVLADMKEYFVTIGDALGDSKKLKAAKEKYQAYHSIPVMTGFGRTVSFMGKQRKKGK